VTAVSAEDRNATRASISAEGVFRVSRAAGRFSVEVTCGDGSYATIERLSVNGELAQDDILDLSRAKGVVTMRISARVIDNLVSGQVTDAAGNPVDGLVALASDDTTRWKPQLQYLWYTRTNNGRFEFRGLPAGRYFAFHDPPRMLGEITEPEYLTVVRSRARTVTVPHVGTVDVRLAPR
jgi:hypothetical protein